MSPPNSNNNHPVVTVFMAVRNDTHHLPESLQSIKDQDYQGRIEVVLADGSDDQPTEQVARAVLPQIRIIPNPDQTTPTGLNRAVAAATGEVLVRCDAHSILPANYVRRVVEILNRTGAATVGGQQFPVGRTTFERAVGMAMTSSLGVGVARYRRGGTAGPTDTVYLGAFRTETMRHLGGYDPALERNQDYELNWRIRSGGGVVWFDPELVVEYRPRPNLWSLVRQYFNYGRWKRVVLKRFPASLRLRHLAAPVLVLGIVSSLVMGVLGWWVVAGFAPLFYVGFVLSGTLFLAIRRPGWAVLLLPIVIPAMHLCWGVGFFLPANE